MDMRGNLLALMTLCTVGAAHAAFDSRAFLSQFSPGTPHEARPHGVPTGYDWQSAAIGGTPVRPNAEATHMNLWGQVYVDLTNYRAPNVRVEVKNCQFWQLIGTTWSLVYRTDDLDGGAWTEDFTRGGGTFDMRTESDGGRSFVPADGYNAHFWPNLPFAPATIVPRAVVVVASTRLVLADPSGADNRSSAAYVIGMGADWRKPDGSCPNNICTGFGVGRFVRATSQWRLVAMTTMSASDIATLSMPPDSVFVLPDGRYADGTTVVRQRTEPTAQRAAVPSTRNPQLYRVDGTLIDRAASSALAGRTSAVLVGSDGSRRVCTSHRR